MPIILLALFMFLSWGYWQKHFQKPQCPRHRTTDVVPRIVPEEPPARPFEVRCYERFQDARLRLVAHEYALDPDMPSLFGLSQLRTGNNPGGQTGVWLTLDHHGVVYTAGVAADQPSRAEFPRWHSFSPGASNRVSWWRDGDGKSGAVAGVDFDETRRTLFTTEMKAAVDDCLRME